MLLTVTLNASIDKAYFVDNEPCLGQVNRVAKVVNSAGGKGLNVTRAILGCGGEALATGFVGGNNGKYLCELLDADNIKHDFVQVQNETRSCINILTDNSSTEFLEPGCAVDQNDLEKFKAKFCDFMTRVKAVIISGSMPTNTPKNFYSQLVDIAKNKNVPAFVDTSREALRYVIQSHPHFIKPNKDEAEELCSTKIDTVEDAISAAKQLVLQGVDIAAISLGSKGAVVADKDNEFHSVIEAPKNLEIKNTVGCGDTFVGAFAFAQCSGKNLKDSLEFALAASKSNALSEKTGFCDYNQIQELLPFANTKQY